MNNANFITWDLLEIVDDLIIHLVHEHIKQIV